MQAEIQWMEGHRPTVRGLLQLVKAGGTVEILSGKDVPVVCYQLDFTLLKSYFL